MENVAQFLNGQLWPLAVALLKALAGLVTGYLAVKAAGAGRDLGRRLRATVAERENAVVRAIIWEVVKAADQQVHKRLEATDGQLANTRAFRWALKKAKALLPKLDEEVLAVYIEGAVKALRDLEHAVMAEVPKAAAPSG